jgi:hypothetical protein
MKEPHWYPAWREDALRELMAKTERLKESHKLGSWPRFDFAPEAGTLTFSDENGPQVIAEVQVVGSINSATWLWSWANPTWDDYCAGDMQRVRQFGEENGIGELTSGCLEDDDLNQLGWEMTAVAARLLGAVGAYRPPDDSGRALFVVCKSMEFVS